VPSTRPRHGLGTDGSSGAYRGADIGRSGPISGLRLERARIRRQRRSCGGRRAAARTGDEGGEGGSLFTRFALD
jgi:hypothetical protein